MANLVAPNLITIAYEEMALSPSEGVGVDKQEATRVFKCAWSNRIVLATQLVGYTRVIGLDTIYYLPHQYPHDGLLHLFATDVKITPFTNKTTNDPSVPGIATYEHAQLTVTYSVPTYDFPEENEETYVTEAIEPATEFMTLPYSGLYWDRDAQNPIDPTDAPGKLVRLTAWVYTLHNLPTLPAAVIDLPGKINRNDVYSWSLNRWFAWETLLCGDPSLSREITAAGATGWTCTFRFIHRNAGDFAAPIGWNEFPEPKAADSDGHILYNTVKTADGNDVLVYELDDFEDLII